MAFGLTTDGFVIKRLADIKAELEQRFKDEFGDEIDLRSATPEGQIIGIMAEREAALWELLQADYDSKNPTKAIGKQLDDVVAITGTTRTPASNSSIIDGVARGTNGTILDPGAADIIISVAGNPSARFKVTGGPYIIDIADGPTFKSLPMTLVAEETGPVVANTGSLTVIETPLAGLDSFINESDAEVGAVILSDADLKLKRNTELQIAGSATIDAIIAELNARPLVTNVIVFQNITSLIDLDGRPPHSLDIVVLGDTEQELADAIFAVVGGGIETIGDESETVLDSEGFSHTIKFSRPTEVEVWIELDLTVNLNLYPVDGDTQVENALLAYGDLQGVGQNVVIYGSNPLICSFEDIPGITDVVVRIGKTASPTLDNNIVIAAREVAKFDSARITIVS